MKYLQLLLLTLFSTVTLTAQSVDAEKLDQLFDVLEQNNKFMGTVEIAHNGKVIYANSIGYENVEQGLKANSKTKYRVGSISKMFTTALVMKAIESGDLTLETKLADYYPKVKNAKSISIKDLLRHSSGIHNFTNDESYLEWDTEFQTKDQMLQRIIEGGSDFKPSSKGEYSNSNFVLLTYILEDVYQESYTSLVSEHITKPLGLKNTYVGKVIGDQENEASSYRFKSNWEKHSETDMSIPVGAGAIVSTPSDLNIFTKALLTGDLISTESIAAMKTMSNGYGLGLFEYPYDDKKSYGHSGGIDSFVAVSSYFEEDDLALSISSNGQAYNYNDILLQILGSYHGKEVVIPDFSSVALTTEQLDQYVGVYESDKLPIDITVTREELILKAQATGQAAFPLDAKGDHKFHFDAAMIKMTFDPANGSFILNQGGGKFTFTKK